MASSTPPPMALALSEMVKQRLPFTPRIDIAYLHPFLYFYPFSKKSPHDAADFGDDWKIIYHSHHRTLYSPDLQLIFADGKSLSSLSEEVSQSYILRSHRECRYQVLLYPSRIILPRSCPRFVSITIWTSFPAAKPGPRPMTKGASLT